MWTRLLLLTPVVSAMSSPKCSGTTCTEGDWTSLLQVSQEVAPHAVALRRDELKSQISRTRAHLEKTQASLEKMEAELTKIEREGIAQPRDAPSLLQLPNDRSFASSTGGMEIPAFATSKLQAPSMAETAPTSASLLAMDMDMEDMAAVQASQMFTNWQGVSMPQYSASESYVMGQGCKTLSNIMNLGGPAALPNMLSNKVVLYAKAGYKGHKLRDAVASAFATELPGTGPWNVAAGKIDWNLYNEGKACTVAVKLPEWGLDWLIYGGH